MTLVDDLIAFQDRFVVMRDEQHLVIALWVVHTYCLDAFEQTPYLAVTSPEKQCGKSRLLEVVEQLVTRPWSVVLPSEAVVYRYIEAHHPTMLLDEVDTVFNPKTAERYEGLRALLNSGHRRGTPVARCIGTSSEPALFDVFCPKVLAGIGGLPDTIADRSIPIRLARKKKDQTVERFLLRNIRDDAEALRTRMEQFAEANVEAITGRFPPMPEQLSDRMQEGTEGLVAIAEILDCADEAREALVMLLEGERLDSHETMRTRLLRDLHEVFRVHLGSASGLHTRSIIDYLRQMEESSWNNYYGRRIDAKDISSLLKTYDVSSDLIRVGDTVLRGYKRDDLYEIWERYAPDLIAANDR